MKKKKLKIWIERDNYGSLFLHLAEPEPDQEEHPNEPIPYGEYWYGKEESISIDQNAENVGAMRKLRRGQCAEFDLNCIWERVK